MVKHHQFYDGRGHCSYSKLQRRILICIGIGWLRRSLVRKKSRYVSDQCIFSKICRIGAKEWFSNRFGCKDSPNGEPEYPANEPCLSTIQACGQDGMAGTSPMGRSDDTRGHRPATRCTMKPSLSNTPSDSVEYRRHRCQLITSFEFYVLQTSKVLCYVRI